MARACELRAAVLLLLATVVFSLPVQAAPLTIFSISGSNDWSVDLVPPGGAGAMGWTATSGYVNVSISADIFSNSDVSQTVTAYLTTQIGSGTTVADQIATDTISIGAGTSGFRSLFTGLDLPAGEYWLTLVSSDTSYCNSCGTPGIGWAETYSFTPILDAGVTYNGFRAGVPAPYPPAVSGGGSGDAGLHLLITGDPASAPEPASATLLILGLTGLCYIRRRSLR